VTFPGKRLQRCDRCGQELIAPERSAYVMEDQIRHIWQCSSCGHIFGTSVDLRAAMEVPEEIVEEFLPSLLVA
jgi:uncharacterized protein with PIN domain